MKNDEPLGTGTALSPKASRSSDNLPGSATQSPSPVGSGFSKRNYPLFACPLNPVQFPLSNIPSSPLLPPRRGVFFSTPQIRETYRRQGRRVVPSWRAGVLPPALHVCANTICSAAWRLMEAGRLVSSSNHPIRGGASRRHVRRWLAAHPRTCGGQFPWHQ